MARLFNMRPDSEVEPELAEHLVAIEKDNQRPRSIRERRLTILRVARWLGHPVATVTEDELEAWQTARLAVLRPPGMKNEIVHVSMYMRWLYETRRREDNPTRVLRRPKRVYQRLPKPMPEGDITTALRSADAEMHVWIGLAAFCGLRCMEIATLQADWIIPGPPAALRVIGKGDKERVIPLPESLLEELLHGPFNQNGYMFNRLDGKPGHPSPVRVSERINKHLHEHGIKLTAHKLRHRYGTEMYRLTKDPFKVAAFMGHASTDTTRGYVALAADDTTNLATAIARISAA